MTYTLEDYLDDMAEFEPQEIDDITMKYYFPTTGSDFDETCTEECKLNKGRMIGSVSCQDCDNCIEIGGCSEYFGPDWIRCKVINDARG